MGFMSDLIRLNTILASDASIDAKIHAQNQIDLIVDNMTKN